MSVTRPGGFLATGVAAGIKQAGLLDMALIAAGCDEGASVRHPPQARPVPAAAVFTLNKVAAAPVLIDRAHLEASGARVGAIVVNSGCANAATGRPGLKVASKTAEIAAGALGLRTEEVLVCSTGVIGKELPLRSVEQAMPSLVASLAKGEQADELAARAIMTTDLRRKQTFADWDGFSLGGIAKGAGMISPNMATMLAFLTTDAKAEPAELRSALSGAVASSFNELTIDGCTSTNDTVIVLASGLAGRPAPGRLEEAMTAACRDLAHQMAADAEGGTKVVRVVVRRAATNEDAARAARAIADSNLVKCSWYGEDPNWGRIVSAAGVSGAQLDPERLAVCYGGVAVCSGSRAVPYDGDAVRAHLAGREIEVSCDLGVGSASASILSADLTHGYVDENTGRS
ncbi:MAG: bifunctional glutamate N-acetyltransferase/amino-acid acetyltransferase ArgJ [Actinomycetota bacterium]|nr:bifunctional glutamate N-acetyltransferase/amino-acid acetyltransferase ArgJ [Actinomycetota bacterium]